MRCPIQHLGRSLLSTTCAPFISIKLLTNDNFILFNAAVLVVQVRHVPIVVNLDVMLAKRKLQLNTVAERIGITPQNLSVLNAGRARAIRFSTLEKLCEVLDCQPGDLLAFDSGHGRTEPLRRASEA